MLLFYIYVAAFAVGGILLGASLFLGHHDEGGDAHVGLGAEGGAHVGLGAEGGAHVGLGAEGDAHGGLGAEGDAHVGLGAEGDAHVGLGAEGGAHVGLGAEGGAHVGLGASHGPELSDFWLPFISVRFWVFFLCFFGLTGTAFTILALASKWVTLFAAVSMGAVTGFIAAFVIQRLKRFEVGAAPGAEDFQGLEGTVLLPLTAEQKGKVRLQLRDQTVDLVARAAEPALIERGARVLILEMQENEVVVVRAPISGANGE